MILQKTSGQEPSIAHHPLSWWVEEYGLPLHIYYSPRIRQNLRAFQDVFNRRYPRGHIRFAAKACPHPEVFKLVIREGAGIDVASPLETRAALHAGASPESLDLNGNCKEDFLISQAIESDMLIVADSMEEFQLVAAMAKGLGKKPRVVLRVSGFDLGAVTAEAVFTAGTWTKFGTPLQEVPEFLKSLHLYPDIRFLGFHTHIGSQITGLEAYQSVLGKLLDLGHLLRDAGGKCEIINIGGGFPVSYVNREEWNRTLERIRRGYEAAQRGDTSQLFIWNNGLAGFATDREGKVDFSTWNDEAFYTPHPKEKMLEALLDGKVEVNGRSAGAVEALKDLGTPALVVEPGRAITGDAGVTLARVAHVRKIAGTHNLVTLEMGVTSFGAALVYIPMHRWELISDPGKQDPTPFEAFVGGNLCFSGDMLAKYKVSFQRRPVRGDLVLIHDTGAYGPQYFAANANAFPRPARVLADERGNLKVLKTRDTYEDVYSL